MPAYIGGPCVLPLTKGADSLSFSNRLIWNVASSPPNDKLPENDFPFWVDVRDVARAHVLALITPDAKGQRFILGPNSVVYSDIADIVHKHFPGLLSPPKEKQTFTHYQIESENCRSILGITEWISFEKLVVDTVDQVLKAQTPHGPRGSQP